MILLIRFIILIISYFCIFGISLALTIYYYTGFSEYEYIWFCSKILTVNKMISRNNDNYHVFSEFNEHGQKLYFQVSYKKYLDYPKL